MTAVFSRVVADLSPQFVEKFPDTFDFLGMLARICEDAGVSVTTAQNVYTLQGPSWPPMERAHDLLASTLAVYGATGTFRPETEGVNISSLGSRPFTALVEAAEAISRGVDLPEHITLFSSYKHQAGTEGDNLNNSEVKNEENCVKNEENCGKNEVDKNDEPVSKVETRRRSLRGRKAKNVNEVSEVCDDVVSDGADDCADTLNGQHNSDEEWIPEDTKDILDDTGVKNEIRQEDQFTGIKTKTVHEAGKRKKKGACQARKATTSLKSAKKPTTTAASIFHKKARQKYFSRKYASHTQKAENKAAFIKAAIKIEPELRRSRGRPKKDSSRPKVGYECDICGFIARTRNALGDHRHRIHLAKPTKCDVCGKVFPNLRYMKRHRTSHVGPQHVCEICGKRYKVLKALRDHRKRHDSAYQPPEFACEICPKKFCTRYILECHVKSEHMGIKKSFLCSTCGKSFTTKHTLQQHVNVHIGARPYPCNICGKTFSYESALRDHKYIHLGTKKFVCKHCDKAFRQRSALKMHEKIHAEQKQFVCGECGRGFTQKQALQRHIRAHKGDKPFSCKLCGRTFGDASIIRRHMILVHKIHKDPSTWREDIITNVKPNKDYYVKTNEDLLHDAEHTGLEDTLDNTDVHSTIDYQPVESPISQASTPAPSMVERTNPIIEVVQHAHSLDAYPSGTTTASYIEMTQTPVEQLVHHSQQHHHGILEETRPSSVANPYAVLPPTATHMDYVQPSSSSHYNYPLSHSVPPTATSLDTQHYETLPRSLDMVIPTSSTREVQIGLPSTTGMELPTIPASSLVIPARIQEVDPTTLRSLEMAMDQPLDATIGAALNSGILMQAKSLQQGEESQVTRPAEYIPLARALETSPQRPEDLAKRLHEMDPPDNLSISAVYAYYTNLASQYMASYGVPPHTDNSGNQ